MVLVSRAGLQRGWCTVQRLLFVSMDLPGPSLMVTQATPQGVATPRANIALNSILHSHAPSNLKPKDHDTL